MRYKQFKSTPTPEILDEVKMSPSALQKFANSPEADGMLMGVEFEMCVPNVEAEDAEPEWELDYDQNQSSYSIDDIIQFFRNGEFSDLSRNEVDRLRGKMYDQYEEWLSEKVREAATESDRLDDLIREKLEADMDWEDYIDDAERELEDEGSLPSAEEDLDARSQAINLKAKELLEEALDDIMANRSGRIYDYAWDESVQELMDDYRNDSDFDEESWLDDIGVDDMRAASREWVLTK